MRSGGRVVAAAAVAAACLGAVGCRTAADETRPIELWAMGREGEMVERLVPDFERAHPGLRVRVQQIPWSAAHEKLLTAYVGEALPDVVQVGSTWIPELTALGALAPLDERLAASPAIQRDDYFPGILDTHVVDGRTMAVPWYVDTRVLFYRTDLLRSAGAVAVPETWSDWLAAMQRLVRLPDRHAIYLPITDWVMPVVLALQHGGELLRGDAEYGNFRSQTMRDAFTFYLRLFQRGLAPAGGTDVVNVHQDFAAGYFAVYPSGPWDLGEFARRLPASLAGEWTTAPMPGRRPGEIGVSLAGGAGLALTAQAARPDDAWTFVEWLSAPAQQIAFYRLTGDLPARRSAWDEAGLREDARAKAFWTQLDHLAETPKIAEWERIATAIGRAGERIVRAEARVETVLADLDGEVDAILEKRRWMLAQKRGDG